MRSPAPQPATREAFTLIELLVAIAIISILVAITLPAIGAARRSASRARESAALQQHAVAYTVYAQDNRSALLPGYVPGEWVTPLPFPQTIEVHYAHSGGRLYGTPARRYTWRLAPYFNYSLDGMILDRRLRAEFAALPDIPTSRTGFQWAVASSPSFGLNSTYVGGDSRRGGFSQPALDRWGAFYITRLEEPLFTDRLLIFATSRGYHPIDGTIVIPGRHRIEGPWRASRNTAVPVFTPWAAPSGPFDPTHTPTTYGHLDFRYSGRVLVATFDGHVAGLTLDEARDMRRWSNQATSADWRPE